MAGDKILQIPQVQSDVTSVQKVASIGRKALLQSEPVQTSGQECQVIMLGDSNRFMNAPSISDIVYTEGNSVQNCTLDYGTYGNGSIERDPVFRASPAGLITMEDISRWNNLTLSGVSGPSSSVSNHIVTFNGTSGTIIKDSGYSITDLALAGHNHDSIYATISALADKVDKVTGYSLVADASILLIHTQNTDTKLNEGGPNEVSALEAKTGYLHSQTVHAPFDAVSLQTVKDDPAIALAISQTHPSGSDDETTLSIKTKLGAASISTDGYLTSADFITFNSKQAAMGSDDNYVTDAEKAALHSHSNLLALNNVSGTNTGDNATNTTSNAYADGKVADSITNGVTTIAPSQNAVFDALALKQPVGTYSTDIHSNITALNAVSGTNTGDNATNATSNAYADGKVADSITNGVTTIAPSQNAVFDALALKQPVGTYSTDIHSNITALNAVSGTNTGDNAVNSLYSGLVSNATHTGEVTGSTALTITDKAVVNARLADVAVNTIKGRISLGTGVPEDLTAANVRTIINVADGANVGVVPNSPITGATKTKITYDAKGLVTSGADATTADIADSLNKRYVTDTDITNLATVASSYTNWNTAYTDRNKWDGGSTGLVAATGRTSLGLVIGVDVLAYRTFGTAANSATTDFAPSSTVSFPGFGTTNSLAAYGDHLHTGVYEPVITKGTTLQYFRGDMSLATLNTSVVPESTNLYFTDSRARSAISLTTLGTSGAATYSDITGVLNIPQYNGTTNLSITGTSSPLTLNSSTGTDVTFTNGTGITLTGTASDITITNASPMVYPAAGIAVSTGSAWGTSITDNSSNWNTAYGWGNHSGLYTPLSHKTTEDAINGLVKVDGAGGYSAVTDNSGNWNTAYGWGNHSGLYAPVAHVGSTGTAHGDATALVAGFMTSSDFSKLAGIAANANNYSLPIASAGTLGGIKIGSGLSIDVDGVVTTSGASIGPGTLNYVPVFTGAGTTIGDSPIYIDSTKVSIGTITPTYKLEVVGTTSTDGIRAHTGFDAYLVPDPTAPTGVVSAGGSVDTGAHWYYVSYYTALGETHAIPTAAQITTTAGNNTVTLTIPTSTDPRVVGRKLYRTKAAGAAYTDYLLATIANNTATSYVDTVADSSVTGLYGIGYFRTNTTNPLLTVSGVKSMTIDTKDTRFGYEAGLNTNGGGRNTLIGSYAAKYLTIATDTVAIGNQAIGYGTLTGYGNVAIGSSSSPILTTGNENTVVGYQTFGNVTNSTNNVVFGARAARFQADGATSLATTQNSVYVGYGTRGFNNSDSNSIVVGYNAIGKGANTAVWGNTSITQHYFTGNINTGTYTIDPTLGANSTYSGLIETGTVGESVVFGDVLYLKFSDGKSKQTFMQLHQVPEWH